ncbi:UDP-galactose transporter [Leishmania major strain Friedlin]|uniref:LPG5B protein n=1 Tax=Leishmania major TaxID=5664 RepID=Q5QHQ6_LEIMA|nr:UDP-galactose transporter [Leishmania major strain Friedlin]AAS75124.1 LPG5B protein [Leishmania major]CAG9572423.1 UDP-galactose_transporter [Leishmania major strain Friedlin]CAJ03561.1 UDP-galactose transporter [Leishmania major strain Friedlin]|eukprot:XP_001682446.1 UDP-galactose transporter [Leishmania major strain Friedlin]
MALIVHVFSMAMVSLVVLVVQNSLLVVMTRFSRKSVDAAHNYHTSTLVMNQEIAKMIMCLVLYGLDDVYRQYRRDAASSNCANNAVHKMVGLEVDVLLLREDSVNDVERKACQAGDKEAQPLADEEPLEVHIHSSPVSLPQTMTVSNASGEGVRRVADEFGASHDAPGVPQVTSTHDSSKILGIAALFDRQPRQPPYLTSSDRPNNASANAKTRAAGHDEWSCSVDVPEKMRKRSFFMYRRMKTLCSLYCSMLSASVYKRDTLKLFVPAFLFNIQNFLIFIGLSNLDAVSFQIWSQTKLLSTAIFSVWLLGRKLSPMQWLSLVTLTAGVLGAQLGAPRASTEMLATAAPHLLHGTTTVPGLDRVGELRAGDDDESRGSALIGIAACVLSGLSSSYASVYFEKVVKTTSPTLSIRNIQLSLFGIPIAFVSMLILAVFPNWYSSVQCGQRVHWNIFSPPAAEARTLGTAKAYCPVRPFFFWQRYDHFLTWALVFIHALGGLLVAIVVKYADNILKGFATGIAVIVSGMMCSAIDRYELSLAFVLGAVFVIGSSIAFHTFEPKR